MVTRIVLASATEIPHALLSLLPAETVVTETSFGYRASCVVEVADPDALREQLRQGAGDVTVGIITGPLATQHARLVMFDVDSTLTTTEAIDLLAAHAGKGKAVAEITERAMRGELDFADSLRARVATLEGLPVSVLDEVAPQMTLSPGALTLVKQLHEHGVFLGMTSGGFIQLVEPLAEELGFEFVSANNLEVATIDGQECLTGRVLGDIVDAHHKANDLAVFAASVGVEAELTVAVGDGANDLQMLAAAGVGIAYCAKPITAERADIAIDFPRLDAVSAFVLAD